MSENWRCNHCKQLNPQRRKICWNCQHVRKTNTPQPIIIGLIGLVAVVTLGLCGALFLAAYFLPALIGPTSTFVATTPSAFQAITNTPRTSLTPSKSVPPSVTRPASPLPADTATATPTATQLPTHTKTIVPELALVISVIDGDTIDVQLLPSGSVVRIRYIGIDTPERGDTCEATATAANQQLVGGQNVRLEKDVSETDQYGRLLRYVYVGDVFVNAELVKQGLAEAKRYPPDTAKANQFEALESQARLAGSGCLWVSPQPTNTPTMHTSTPSISPGGYVCAGGEACIKGNINSSSEKIYHFPGCASYEDTRINPNNGERWFTSSTEAEAAGWRRARNCP